MWTNALILSNQCKHLSSKGWLSLQRKFSKIDSGTSKKFRDFLEKYWSYIVDADARKFIPDGLLSMSDVMFFLISTSLIHSEIWLKILWILIKIKNIENYQLDVSTQLHPKLRYWCNKIYTDERLRNGQNLRNDKEPNGCLVETLTAFLLRLKKKRFL